MQAFMARFARNPLRVLVLTLLRSRPMSGIEIISQVETLTGGLWRPSPGAVYPLLHELEQQGLVKHTEIDGRKIYSLTERGLLEAEECGLGTRPAGVDDVVQVLEGYVEYLKDYASAHGLPEEARQRIARLARELGGLAGSP